MLQQIFYLELGTNSRFCFGTNILFGIKCLEKYIYNVIQNVRRKQTQQLMTPFLF